MKTMPRPMSNQHALNNVIEWFLVQKHLKSAGATNCVYRAPDGTNGCAIGCQLPDRLYRGQENVDVTTLLLGDKGIENYFNKVSNKFLQALQNAHDFCGSGQFFHIGLTEELKKLARRYNLNWPKGVK